MWCVWINIVVGELLKGICGIENCANCFSFSQKL